MDTVLMLILAGAALIAAETVLPGLIAGTIGAICLLAGVLLAYRDLPLETAHWVLAGTLIGLVAGTVGWFRWFPRSPMARLLVSRGTVGSLHNEQPELLSQEGTAVTPLRPSGTALIGGRRVDVVTEGGFVARGTPLRVVAIEGLRVVVRPVQAGAVQEPGMIERTL